MIITVMMPLNVYGLNKDYIGHWAESTYDIGFGDVIYPERILMDFTVLYLKIPILNSEDVAGYIKIPT